MPFSDLFKQYPNRNAELRSIVMQCYEFGKTVAKEPSASLSSGIDIHAITRQRSYIEYVKKLVDAIYAKPIPDLPASHPLDLPIDMEDPYVTFTTDVGGNQVPLNEQTQLLAEYWMITAVEMAKSQSASIAGSFVKFDWIRTKNNLEVMSKLLNEMTYPEPILDLPETSEPGSAYGTPSTATKK